MPTSEPEVLSKIPLFSHLSSRQVRKLLKTTMEHRYEADTTIVREGSRTTTLYVLLEGSVKIVRDGRTISRRDPGEYFGEIALIDSGPRSATIVATTDLRCQGITAWEFRPFIEEHPEVAWPLLETLASRLRDAEKR